MPPRTSPDLRARVIQAYEEGDRSTTSLSARFKISQPTIWRLLHRYKAGQGIAPRPHGGGQQPLIPPSKVNRLIDLLAKTPDATTAELAAQYQRKWKTKVSARTMAKTLRRLGFTCKKKVFHADEQTRPDVQEKRKRHRAVRKKISAKSLVFLDETGVNQKMTREEAWSPMGSPTVSARPGVSRRNHTVIGAMRQSGPVKMRSFRGGMKKGTFIAYVCSVLTPALKRGDVLVMDNLAAHHAVEVQRAVENVGVRLLFLPPYSPDMNPIERLWSVMKRRFRARFQRLSQSVRRAVGGAWRSLKNLDMTRLIQSPA